MFVLTQNDGVFVLPQAWAGHLMACAARQFTLDYRHNAAHNSGNGTERLASPKWPPFV
jgi:hypothetical protein